MSCGSRTPLFPDGLRKVRSWALLCLVAPSRTGNPSEKVQVKHLFKTATQITRRVEEHVFGSAMRQDKTARQDKELGVELRSNLAGLLPVSPSSI